MQKVVGSNPIIRFPKALPDGAFVASGCRDELGLNSELDTAG
jgi:hypothetical protein